jgi:uncharacterized membrane protein YqjE
MENLIEPQRYLGLYPTIKHLLHEIVCTAQNRFELFVLELREEKARALELLLWTATMLFLGIMTFIILTAAILLLTDQETRVYVSAGFTILYFGLSVYAALRVKKNLKQFAQLNRQCLESLK